MSYEGTYIKRSALMQAVMHYGESIKAIGNEVRNALLERPSARFVVPEKARSPPWCIFTELEGGASIQLSAV